MGDINNQTCLAYRYNLEVLPADITRKEIIHFFYLSDEDISFIKQKGRLSPYRIAMAVLIGSYKFIGRFPKNINETPEPIIKYLYKVSM